MRPILLSEQEIQVAAEQHKPPLYLYNLNKVARQYTQLRQHLPTNFRIYYTLKANSNLSICQKLAQLGCGADISSAGELAAALKTGLPANQIVFTGPGKSNWELTTSLKANIGLIALESVNEAKRLNHLASQQGQTQDVLIRINPLYGTEQSCEIRQQGQYGKNNSCSTDPSHSLNDAGASMPIQTIASTASKFGIDEAKITEQIAIINALPHLNLKGIHIFTESNVLDYNQLLDSWKNTINIANRLNDQGYPIAVIDFGGGIGIPYNAVDGEFDTQGFGQELEQLFNHNTYAYECIVEVGRYLVGEAGCYITEVVDIKESLGQTFIILDGGVHQLLRLSMKPASQYLEILGRQGEYTQTVTLGGKLPTPLGIVVEDVKVPEDIAIGDRVVIYNCGAYGFNHSLTNFAFHNYPAEVAYQDGTMQLIRCHGKVEDFFINQSLPFVVNSVSR
jgi:diaminopimelate decarboxylase